MKPARESTGRSDRNGTLVTYAYVHIWVRMLVRDRPHELDIRRVLGRMAHLRLCDAEIGLIVGTARDGGRSTVRTAAFTAWQLRRLTILAELADLLCALLGDDAHLWLRRPNAGLSLRRPIDLLVCHPDGLPMLRGLLGEEAAS